jgi:hypothetical protein
MRILEGVDIESFIRFLNDIDENHWILVEWRPDIECKIIPSICAVTKEYLIIFRNWLIENQDFIWSDEDGSNQIIKSGADILQECVFYYDENMITLYQRLHEINQQLKIYRNNSFSVKYDFQKFVEDNLLNECEEKDDDNYENEDDHEKYSDEMDDDTLYDDNDTEEPSTVNEVIKTCYYNSEDRFNAEVLEQIFQKPFLLSRK